MKFSDDEDDEMESKSETKIEDEGICLDEDQGM